MVDSYDKISLSYSGGSDSGFVLCCINDLITEGELKKDTIEIWQGIFILDGEPQSDSERATRFANSLGFEPRICKFKIDNAFNIKIMDYALEFFEKYQAMPSYEDPYICCLQNYVSSLQDSNVIRISNTGTSLGFPLHKAQSVSNGLVEVSPNLNHWSNNWLIPLNQVIHYDSYSNDVEIMTWDNKVFSCLISPFKIRKRFIDTEPFEKLPLSNNPLHPNKLNKYMDKWMIYLQCYPKMFEIFYKFQTFKNGWRLDKLPNQKETKIVKKTASILEKINIPTATKVKLSNGEYFTTKDLTNYEDYF
jgi:hypothetical protein|tara:strand:- start:8972 stop:9886 length:915 start_codon:yes stop_codon:yes gene_type:complete